MATNEYNQATAQPAPEHVHTVTTTTQDISIPAPAPAPALVVPPKREPEQRELKVNRYQGYGL